MSYYNGFLKVPIVGSNFVYIFLKGNLTTIEETDLKYSAVMSFISFLYRRHSGKNHSVHQSSSSNYWIKKKLKF